MKAKGHLYIIRYVPIYVGVGRLHQLLGKFPPACPYGRGHFYMEDCIESRSPLGHSFRPLSYFSNLEPLTLSTGRFPRFSKSERILFKGEEKPQQQEPLCGLGDSTISH